MGQGGRINAYHPLVEYCLKVTYQGKYLGLICRTRIRLLKLQGGKNDY